MLSFQGRGGSSSSSSSSRFRTVIVRGEGGGVRVRVRVLGREFFCFFLAGGGGVRVRGFELSSFEGRGGRSSSSSSRSGTRRLSLSSSSIARVRTVIVGGPRRGLGVRGSFFGVQERGGGCEFEFGSKVGIRDLGGGRGGGVRVRVRGFELTRGGSQPPLKSMKLAPARVGEPLVCLIRPPFLASLIPSRHEQRLFEFTLLIFFF